MVTSDSEADREKTPAVAAQFANTHWSVVLSARDKTGIMLYRQINGVSVETAKSAVEKLTD